MRCILVLVAVVALAEGSRILIANPYGTRSHQNVYVPLTKELVRRGHQVTIITNYFNEELTQFENVRQIWLKSLVVNPALYPNPFSKPTTFYEKMEITRDVFAATFNYTVQIFETTYQDPRVQELFANDKFDLVMISEICGPSCYPFGWHFNAPTILLTPNQLYVGRAPMLGDDDHLSYVPFLFSPYSDRMSLPQRVLNVFSAKMFYYFTHDLYLYETHSMFKKLINKDCPSLIELEKNFSLAFTISHPVFNYPRVLPPQVIELGGLHCRPAKPLPEELEAFVSESQAGFIMFGVGSTLNMEEVPEYIIQSIMKAFSRLPQRVIWQWKGKARSDLPKNVLAMSWLPQQDLLGHKNCRAFLTHGGLNGLQEAVYHGVQVLGFPAGSDQIMNINKAVKEGYAVKLDWKDLTEETLLNSINLLLHDSRYKQSALRVSQLFRDQMNTPLERAVYWTEYVLRHNGTAHLRLGSVDLAPYQRNLVDVYFVLVVSSLIPLLLTVLCVRKCMRRSVSFDKKQQ